LAGSSYSAAHSVHILLLTSGASAGLGEAGFRVLTHSRVPCNDGGISLGQAVVAGARDRLGQL
jgi:hydrogenase maturation protein HypF